MFTNPNTLWIEILVVALTVAFLATIIGVYIYRKAKGLPTGECACCHKGTKKLLNEYHKSCCCKK